MTQGARLPASLTLPAFPGWSPAAAGSGSPLVNDQVQPLPKPPAGEGPGVEEGDLPAEEPDEALEQVAGPQPLPPLASGWRVGLGLRQQPFHLAG